MTSNLRGKETGNKSVMLRGTSFCASVHVEECVPDSIKQSFN